MTIRIASGGFLVISANAVSKSSGDILEDLGFARITPSATATSLDQHGWTHWYRGVGSDATQGGRAPDVIVKYLKAKKVYIAHDKTEYGQGLATIVLILLSEGFHRSPYFVLPDALAVLSFVGTLLFARFMGRHL